MMVIDYINMADHIQRLLYVREELALEISGVCFVCVASSLKMAQWK